MMGIPLFFFMVGFSLFLLPFRLYSFHLLVYWWNLFFFVVYGCPFEADGSRWDFFWDG